MAQRTIDGQKMTFYGDTQAEVYRKIDEYTKRKSKPATFREIAEAWQDAKWDSFAPGTLNCYRSAYERAVDAFGDIAADEVTAGMIMRLLDSMIAKRYSGKSVKTQKTVISTIYRNAIIEGKDFESRRKLRYPPRTSEENARASDGGRDTPRDRKRR